MKRMILLLLACTVLVCFADEVSLPDDVTATLTVLCGERFTYATLTVTLYTDNDELGTQLNWTPDGPPGHHTYSKTFPIEVRVHSLNSLPHNGYGDGNNNNHGNAYVTRTIKNNTNELRVGGISIPETDNREVEYTYLEHTKTDHKHVKCPDDPHPLPPPPLEDN